MFRFVLVSFLLLGLAFYELSGGADFEPAKVRRSVEFAPESPVDVTERDAVIVVAQPAEARPLQAETVLAQVETLATKPVVTAPPPQPTAAEQIKFGLTTLPNGGAPVTRLSALETTGTALAGLGTAGLSVLIDAASDDQAPTEVMVEEDVDGPDIRQITATRVNMRGGPGTGFDVVGQLSQGTQVRVVGEPSNGWLMLRTVGDDQLGYVAASLVSAPNG
ncbi:SH3 domain-containing protein [Chachezhania sediminis]|uniref:SH3 domain-containing protein n=1 Tax=Chachezhania sediminis TaxID=2599291 RepID=UPI00131CBE48|nr:SH3 domain-containing protein [Chachezhania sediminis]